jgi:nucleotide-binding universal stress UspA family protein
VTIGELDRMLERIDRANRESLALRKRQFENWCTKHGIGHEIEQNLLASTFAVWEEVDGTIEEVVMRRGRLSDLIVVKRPEPTEFAASRCLDAAVFASGRSTLVASAKEPANLLGHVVIAWNGSLEATHAVSQCIDLLHEAERVSIFSAKTSSGEDHLSDNDLAEALRWHGINANHLPSMHQATSVGAALLQAATAAEGTLIVMGAYTHSRVREALLGGVTRHVLQHTTLPVIMAH